MRNLKSIALALVALVSFTLNAQTKTVNTEKSNILWEGKKVTGKHNGDVKVKSGSLTFAKKVLTGGSVVVDMTSINSTDVTGGTKKSLDGHLKADDFFGVEKFPEATLTFKTVKSKGKGVYAVTADLTIKGITNSVTFNLTVKGNNASTTLMVNRTKFDIKYGSGSFFDNLGDKAINDEFELKVNLVF
jgi:polyisoprenoid-binding protein YceI